MRDAMNEPTNLIRSSLVGCLVRRFTPHVGCHDYGLGNAFIGNFPGYAQIPPDGFILLTRLRIQNGNAF
jgi:hypothetical protein